MTAAHRLQATQVFFSPRAADWEARFPADGPRFDQAVSELAVPPGARALDVGCGTGRALAPLRAAVGPAGQVLGVDATPAMLAEAHRLGRYQAAGLVVGDALRLPLTTGWAAAVFAGGVLPHLDDPAAALAEWARVTGVGGRLAIFHPLSRVALAARHQSVPSDDDVLASARLRGLCAAAGWQVLSLDDAPDRYLALAVRR